MTISPENCAKMADVRAGVDRVDEALVALLAQRFEYMRAAARIKADRNMVRDEARKAAVINNAVALSRAHDLPDALVAELWEQLVEASIAYELKYFDALKGGQA